MYKAFEKWLNGVLEENMPIPGVALNFNLYEEADFCWSIQLIGASCFDEEEEDWCCEETFCSGENRFSWKEHAEWEEILDVSCKMIRQYISNGKYAEALKKYETIAAGFVDGDLEILYQRQKIEIPAYPTTKNQPSR